MNLVYVTNSRIPTEKAYGLQTASMCAAFASLGASVTLVIPERKHNPILLNLFTYYSIERNFEARYIPTIDAIGIGRRFGFWVTRLSYAFSLLFSPALRKEPGTVIFTRDLIAAVLLKLRGHRVFYDMHGFPCKFLWFWKKACRMMDGTVCTNQWKIEQCKSVFGIAASKLLMARNGFDASLFQHVPDIHTARDQLSLPNDSRIAVYTGHLLDWKGVDVLAQAAERLGDVQFIFVGGTPPEVQQFASRHKSLNIVMAGQKPHNEIPTYLAAADVLVLPNSAQAANPRFVVYSQYDTSPLKLFEYMASKRPIVASGLPSVKEILNESNAMLVLQDNPDSLAAGISSAFSDQASASQRAEQAYQDVQQYTWDNRARLILDFIKAPPV